MKRPALTRTLVTLLEENGELHEGRRVLRGEALNGWEATLSNYTLTITIHTKDPTHGYTFVEESDQGVWRGVPAARLITAINREGTWERSTIVNPEENLRKHYDAIREKILEELYSR